MNVEKEPGELRQPQDDTTHCALSPLRLEEASLNAWPALQQVLLGGWVLRFSKGFTKRSNCIVPLYTPNSGQASGATRDISERELHAKVRYCENLYAGEQLQTVFRLTSISPDTKTLQALLDARGYQTADISQVLSKSLAVDAQHPPALAPVTSTRFQLLPLDDWLGVYCLLTGMPASARALHAQILQTIPGETAFGVLVHAGQPVGCGLAVIEQNLVGLFDIFTHPNERQRGWGASTVNHLLNWAIEKGATCAYLQMVAANSAANALYRSLGFTPSYHYWYRVGR